MAHRAEPERATDAHLVDWPASVAFAVFGTAAAVGLIVLFTYLVDWIGAFWSQVVYFLALFALVVVLAARDRNKDARDPARLTRGASITPAGLPGPFVLTQALGVLGVAMLVVGAFVGGGRGIVWLGASLVLLLVGAVGLLFWLSSLDGRRGFARREPFGRPSGH